MDVFREMKVVKGIGGLDMKEGKSHQVLCTDEKIWQNFRKLLFGRVSRKESRRTGDLVIKEQEKSHRVL